MPNAAALQEFKDFPFAADKTISNLAAELPACLAFTDGIVTGMVGSMSLHPRTLGFTC